MQHVCISARGNQTGNHAAFQHVAGATSVLAYHDTGLASLARTVVPADETPDFVCMLNGKLSAGYAAEAVCAKVLHFILLFTNEPLYP